MDRSVLLLVLSSLLIFYSFFSLGIFLFKLYHVKSKDDGRIHYVGGTLQLVLEIINTIIFIVGIIGFIIYKDNRYLGVSAIETSIMVSLLKNMLISTNSRKLCIKNALIDKSAITNIEFKSFLYLYQLCIVKAKTVETIILNKNKVYLLVELKKDCQE